MEVMSDLTNKAVPKTILAIDENRISRMVLEEELGAFGFLVTIAENAQKGIDCALKNTPDLITVDLTLNGVSGIDVINKLRGSKQTCDIPILVVTGNESLVEQEHALNLGALKVFKKPFKPGEVGKFIDKHFHYPGKNVGKRRILLVEDSDTIRAITKYLLSQQGHIVVEASDGVAGWEALNNSLTGINMGIDMVITDINMPRMNGQELVEKVREDNRFQFIPIIVSSTISEKESIKLLLNTGADDYIVKPFSSEEFLARIESHLRVKTLYGDLHRANEQLAKFNETLEKRVEERTIQLREANLEAIYSLATAAEAKDDTTGNHLNRIQQFSKALACQMGVPDHEAEEIGYSSIMHDVGKISIPDEILKKPGKLTAEEFDTMKTHSKHGERILPPTNFFYMARQIARSHHEKWNGLGYPDGLKGMEVPLTARIVAVADVFDALTTKRPYKEPWTVEKALDEVMSLSGVHFDPAVIDAWERLLKSGDIDRILKHWV